MNGVKQHQYSSYDEYREIQERTTHRKIGSKITWARQQDIQYLAEYVKSRVTPRFGICHGTRSGEEQRWFSECLGCEVLGTDISSAAAGFPNTICWDFHELKPEWVNAVDFIYSNAFDHSYDPKKALDAWMACTRLCIIEHTQHHGPKHVSEIDPFGAELEVMPYLITLWGDGRYWLRQILKHGERTFLVIER